MDFRDKLIFVGKIVNTFSMKGTIKLLLDDQISFDENKMNDSQNEVLFYLDNEKVFQPLQISKIVKNEGNLLLVNFDGYDDINSAEKLKNYLVYAKKDDDFFIQEPDYLDFEFDYQLGKDKFKTNIIDVMTNGQYLLFKILVQDKEIWVPNVDAYIREVDIDKKQIIAKDIEGLLI